MIYSVKSEYFQAFLSAKQGGQTSKDRKDEDMAGSNQVSNGDAMDTD